MKGRARPALAALLALATAAATTAPAAAQSRRGFAVARFEPTERGSRWLVVDGLDYRGRAEPSFGLTLDYAHKPLAVFDSAERERFALVRHQFVAHAGAAIVLAERLRLGIDMPFAVYQDGESVVVRGVPLAAATAPALADVRVAADIRVVGRHAERFTLAVGVRAWMPTGVSSQFTSDGAARVGPQVLAAGRLGPLDWGTRATLIYRPRDDSYAGQALGSELGVAGGLSGRVGRLSVGPETFASTGIGGGKGGERFFARRSTPVEVLLGGHYALPGGLLASAGAGIGLTSGFGAPSFRGLVSIGWSPEKVDPPTGGRGGRSDDSVTDFHEAWSGGPAEVRPAPPPPLAVVETGEIRIAEQIAFATGSAEILHESDAILAAVTRILEERPSIRRVRIEGHTDATGPAGTNDALGRHRAEAVASWLVAHGISADRLLTEGYGSQRPVADEATPEGRAKNRRVVFTIVDDR